MQAEKSMLPEEGMASLTISNLCNTGLSQVTEIITPPQVSIMAVGQPSIVLSNENTLSKCMAITLSSDGRIVNEQISSKFLSIIKMYIQDPLSSSC